MLGIEGIEEIEGIDLRPLTFDLRPIKKSAIEFPDTSVLGVLDLEACHFCLNAATKS